MISNTMLFRLACSAKIRAFNGFVVDPMMRKIFSCFPLVDDDFIQRVQLQAVHVSATFRRHSVRNRLKVAPLLPLLPPSSSFPSSINAPSPTPPNRVGCSSCHGGASLSRCRLPVSLGVVFFLEAVMCSFFAPCVISVCSPARIANTRRDSFMWISF